MRFSFIVLFAALLVMALPRPSSAAPSAAIPSCHSLGAGVYTRASIAALSQAGANDIVPGKPGKNFSGANVGIFYYGCKVPPVTLKPVAPPKPADPNAGKYPIETGPVQ